MELTWTNVEKAAFLHANLSSFGKDSTMIEQCVGTRSQYQGIMMWMVAGGMQIMLAS